MNCHLERSGAPVVSARRAVERPCVPPRAHVNASARRKVSPLRNTSAKPPRRSGRDDIVVVVQSQERHADQSKPCITATLSSRAKHEIERKRDACAVEGPCVFRASECERKRDSTRSLHYASLVTRRSGRDDIAVVVQSQECHTDRSKPAPPQPCHPKRITPRISRKNCHPERSTRSSESEIRAQSRDLGFSE